MAWHTALTQKLNRGMAGVNRTISSVSSAAEAMEAQENKSQAQSGFFAGAAALEGYYFPHELTGGVCPRVIGQEREIAWHAAAEACDTERVHMVWSVTDDKVWYLAARSAEFASHTHTWCPFTSLLPGMNDAQPAPVCYAYYSDEAAIMMTVTADSLQIHRGTSAVVRAKAERLAREASNTKLIALEPEVIIKLTPAAWQSIALFEDRVRRLLTALVVLIGTSCAVLAFCVWLFAAISIMNEKQNLSEIQERSNQKSMELLQAAEQSRISTLRAQIARFAELNEQLVEVGGWMKLYQIKGSGVRWRALVPPSITGDKIKDMGAKFLTTTDKGIIIGTDNEPMVKK